MGFTTVIEPAVPTHAALHSHLELADVPIIDKGILTVVGEDDFLLSLLRDGGKSHRRSRIISPRRSPQTKGLGIKSINPGGSVAFADNARTFDLDDVVPFYGVTSRQITEALQQGVMDIGIAHPLHLHYQQSRHRRQCRDGAAHVAGGRRQAAASRASAVLCLRQGRQARLLLGRGAARRCRQQDPNVTIDVGQVMFRQTVTISCDVVRQFTLDRHRQAAQVGHLRRRGQRRRRRALSL